MSLARIIHIHVLFKVPFRGEKLCLNYLKNEIIHLMQQFSLIKHACGEYKRK